MQTEIRTIIVDDHPVYRKGINMLLSRIPNVKVIGEAQNGLEFLHLLENKTPDLVFMDYLMPGMDGLEASILALTKFPELKIIAMTMMNNEMYLNKMLLSGIMGLIPKNTSKNELQTVIKQVSSGVLYISGSFNKQLILNNLKPTAMFTTKKVLIVDDDIDVINVMEAILKKENFEVVTASNKEEGLAKAKAVKPDLAILDVMMTTHFEGFEMAKEFKENQELKKIPVLMQTSIDVLTTTNSSVQDMARQFRLQAPYKELEVLLVKDINSGKAGIDYQSEDGKSVWFPVEGFIKKPVSYQKIMTEINRIFKN